MRLSGKRISSIVVVSTLTACGTSNDSVLFTHPDVPGMGAGGSAALSAGGRRRYCRRWRR